MNRIAAIPGRFTRHDMQELEANRIAIEVVAPRRVIERMSSDEPSLTDALDIAALLDLSKSSAGRRYVELHRARLAMGFTQHGRIIYTIPSRDCPKVLLKKETISSGLKPSLSRISSPVRSALKCAMGRAKAARSPFLPRLYFRRMAMP